MTRSGKCYHQTGAHANTFTVDDPSWKWRAVKRNSIHTWVYQFSMAEGNAVPSRDKWCDVWLCHTVSNSCKWVQAFWSKSVLTAVIYYSGHFVFINTDKSVVMNSAWTKRGVGLWRYLLSMHGFLGLQCSRFYEITGYTRLLWRVCCII